MNKKDTLIERLNDIVDEVHIDEVKDIIYKLTQINLFKHSIEDNLSIQVLYEKISKELKKEFLIDCFKLSLISDIEEEILYSQGVLKNNRYSYSTKVLK